MQLKYEFVGKLRKRVFMQKYYEDGEFYNNCLKRILRIFYVIVSLDQ